MIHALHICDQMHNMLLQHFSNCLCARYNSSNSDASDNKEGSDAMTCNTIRWPLTESNQHTNIQPTKISACLQMIILSVT